MKSVFTKSVSLVLLLLVLVSVTVPAFAASQVTNYNVSYSAVSGNASNARMPSGISQANVSDRVYFNFQVDSSQRIKKVVVNVMPSGYSNYYSCGSETATNYMRYAYISFTVPNRIGTLKYVFRVTYTNGSVRDYNGSIRVVEKGPSGKIRNFVNDSRWKDGVSWGYYQRPKLSTYSSMGCCAYAADFVKYVYGKNSPRSGSYYTGSGNIRSGDVIYVTPQHWMVVVSRNGNTLQVMEGNYSSRVHSATYRLSGNSILRSNGTTYKTFSYGYHF